MAKHDRTGRSARPENYAKLFLTTMETPAWRALTPYAQRLYPWLQLEWHGPRQNNNGKIRFSVRQTSDALGCNTETARKALADLQRKGFIVVKRCATLGSAGEARGHEYELTELGTPGEHRPRRLYLEWTPKREFEVKRARANNPRGVGWESKFRNPTHAVCSAQHTGPEGPNTRGVSNEAENSGFPTHAVCHPYYQGTTGRRYTSQPIDAAARFIGEPRRFAVVLPSGALRRVGVRTTLPSNPARATSAEVGA